MSDFEIEYDEFDTQLDGMLDQLGPDPLPAGFTSRTMLAIRSEAAERPPVSVPFTAVPFRLHWSDFVPALVAAVFGTIVLLISARTPAAVGWFDGVQTSTLLAGASDFQLAALFSLLGLLVAAVPFWVSNIRSRSLLLLTLPV